MTRPLLLGHRGARSSRHIPENTLASFELCLQHGCDGFEFDVRQSVDGEAVICHDTTHNGMEIAKTTAKRLALTTLEEVLLQFSSRAFLDIELKAAGLEQLMVAALRKRPPQKGHVVSSFLPEVLTSLHVLDASIPMGLLCASRKQLRGWPLSPAEWVIAEMELADQELISQVHSSGRKIMVWTVNRAEKIRQLSDWGVDAIISDETERVAQVVLGL